MAEVRPGAAPVILDYGRGDDAGGWPVGLYVGALVWAFVTLHLTYELPKGPAAVARNNFRFWMQVALLACAAIRLVWARHRKEKGRGWMFYVVLLGSAAPLWFLAEHIDD
jgi:hypothetical protein